MQFFNFLPKIFYDNIFEIRNLFYKYYFIEKIPNEYLYNYILKEGESLETISFDVYNDPIYWWVLAIINNIKDIIFDLPLASSILQQMAYDQSFVDEIVETEVITNTIENYEFEDEVNYEFEDEVNYDFDGEGITSSEIVTSTINKLDYELFSENFDILEKENDEKRKIKILKPSYLNEILINIIRENP